MAHQRRQQHDGKPKFKPIKPPPKPRNLSSSSFTMVPPFVLFLGCILAMCAVLAAFFYLKQSSDGSQEWSVYRKGFVTSDLSYKTVLSESGSSRIVKDKRHFNASVLAYVTPWNSRGYEMAKQFRDKFTHVSPVWYQLKCGDSLQLQGRHNVDQNWIDSVRIKGRPRIFPRVTLEGWPMDSMLVQQDEKKRALNIIAAECKSMQYDGVVLEAWNAWAAMGILGNPILRQRALHFVRDLGLALHRVILPRPQLNLQLIFVIPPPSTREDANQFTAADAAFLGTSVDGYSLMTYDFSNPYRPGPNAPLPWVRSCLRLLLGNVSAQTASHKDPTETEGKLAPRVLTGLNFYGNDFIYPNGGGPIIAHEYLTLLRKHKPTMMWDDEAKEHFFEYFAGKKQHIVYFPSLKSLALRLEEANIRGTGISIWEIGQGLEYFFDLL